MTNDECRMTKEIRMRKIKIAASVANPFVIPASTFHPHSMPVRLGPFVLRHYLKEHDRDSRSGLRLREDAWLRSGLPLGKIWEWICWRDWRKRAFSGAAWRHLESSFWRDAKTSTRDARATQDCGALFRARSSSRGDLRVVPAGSDHERGTRFLSRPSNHSPAKMGMPGHVYLLFDETGGAYPANCAGVASAIWGKERNPRTRSFFISIAQSPGANERE